MSATKTTNFRWFSMVRSAYGYGRIVRSAAVVPFVINFHSQNHWMAVTMNEWVFSAQSPMRVDSVLQCMHIRSFRADTVNQSFSTNKHQHEISDSIPFSAQLSNQTIIYFAYSLSLSLLSLFLFHWCYSYQLFHEQVNIFNEATDGSLSVCLSRPYPALMKFGRVDVDIEE